MIEPRWRVRVWRLPPGRRRATALDDAERRGDSGTTIVVGAHVGAHRGAVLDGLRPVVEREVESCQRHAGHGEWRYRATQVRWRWYSSDRVYF